MSLIGGFVLIDEEGSVVKHKVSLEQLLLVDQILVHLALVLDVLIVKVQLNSAQIN